MNQSFSPFGQLLKRWRSDRGLSQLQLALATETSPRHLSFIETGRSRPKRELVMKLAEHLDIPLRERNELLTAAGLTPSYPDQDYNSDALSPYRFAVQQLIENHLPYPALILNRWGEVVDANRTALSLFPELRADQPINLYDAYLTSEFWRQRVLNWPEVAWAAYRYLLKEAARYPADTKMRDLVERVRNYAQNIPESEIQDQTPAIRTRFQFDGEILETTAMIAQFGPAKDVFLSELRVELIFPADATTQIFFEKLAGGDVMAVR